MARFLLALLLLSGVALAKDCVPFDQAADHIGKKTCVSGKVLKVAASQSGSLFLDFCEDYRKCPFTVIIFRRNLADVGDVRLLEGKEIEIYGKIKEWHGRSEIILTNAKQLQGDAANLPPIPKTYDADRRGNYSAGKYSSARSRHPTHKRNSKIEEEIDEE